MTFKISSLKSILLPLLLDNPIYLFILIWKFYARDSAKWNICDALEATECCSCLDEKS